MFREILQARNTGNHDDRMISGVSCFLSGYYPSAIACALLSQDYRRNL
jgi:hypothetical protein